MIKHKIVNTKTFKGLKQAEKLQKSGWQMGNIGFWDIVLYKNFKSKTGHKQGKA